MLPHQQDKFAGGLLAVSAKQTVQLLPDAHDVSTF